MLEQTNACAKDIIQYGYEIGRLDYFSCALTVFSIAIVILGFCGFGYFRYVAQMQAEKIAQEVAEKITEKVVNEYMQAEMPKILKEYEEFFKNKANLEDADAIASAQDNGDNDDT